MILAKGRAVEIDDLLLPPANGSTPPGGAGNDSLVSLSELEKQHILRVLKASNGNKTQAAKVLGISVRNLYRKLEEYRISG